MSTKNVRKDLRRRSERGPRGGRGPTGAGRRRFEDLTRNSGTLIIGGTIVLAVALVAFGMYTGVREAGRVSDFPFRLYQGEEALGGDDDLRFVDLVSQGEPVVLNFWGGSCPPCRFEMPDLQAAYDAHQDEIIMLGLDVGVHFGLGTEQTALRLLDELDVTYPAGAPRNNGPVADYGVHSLPFTIFFGSDGEIARRWEGTINERQLDSVISDLLHPS